MQKYINLSLEYIEQNLKTDISLDELAEKANYSVGHYCRLFAQTMGTSATHYILKRRIDHALMEISLGGKAICVVLDYGFDNYAGFYKAFVKMYGCSPKKYLNIYKKSEVFIMHYEKDIRTILENWGIMKGLNILDVSSKNWKTGDIDWQIWQVGDDYYLKTNERSKMIINIKIAKALRNEGLLSEFLPIQTLTGNDYLDGQHLYLLTKKIGQSLNNHPLSNREISHLENNDSREKHAYKLGQGIGRLHKALKSVQDEVNPDEANLYKQVIRSIPKVKEYSLKYNMGISDDFFDDYTTKFRGLFDLLPKQLIHGNLVGDSAVHENGEVICFKGFEMYNVSNIRLFDVAYSAGEINIKQIESYIEMLKNIFKGYESINPLTIEEKQSAYYVLCSIGMNMLAYCDETLDVSSRNREAVAFLSRNKERFMNLI